MLLHLNNQNQARAFTHDDLAYTDKLRTRFSHRMIYHSWDSFKRGKEWPNDRGKHQSTGSWLTFLGLPFLLSELAFLNLANIYWAPPAGHVLCSTLDVQGSVSSHNSNKMWQNLHRRGQQLLSKEKEILSGSWWWMVPGRGISTLDVIQLWAKIWSKIITGSTETGKSVPWPFLKKKSERKGEGSEGTGSREDRPIQANTLRTEVQLVKTDFFFFFGMDSK